MLERMTSKLLRIWDKFRSKNYRDAFVASNIRTTLAAQIAALREARGLTQEHLAVAASMKQSRISLLEDPSYDKMSLATLKRLASAFDVALSVRFVPYSTLLRRVNSTHSDNLNVVSFQDDEIKAAPLSVDVNDGIYNTHSLRPLGQQTVLGRDSKIQGLIDIDDQQRSRSLYFEYQSTQNNTYRITDITPLKKADKDDPEFDVTNLLVSKKELKPNDLSSSNVFTRAALP